LLGVTKVVEKKRESQYGSSGGGFNFAKNLAELNLVVWQGTQMEECQFNQTLEGY
jgi:hypothetical protein